MPKYIDASTVASRSAWVRPNRSRASSRVRRRGRVSSGSRWAWRWPSSRYAVMSRTTPVWQRMSAADGAGRARAAGAVAAELHPGEERPPGRVDGPPGPPGTGGRPPRRGRGSRCSSRATPRAGAGRAGVTDTPARTGSSTGRPGRAWRYCTPVMPDAGGPIRESPVSRRGWKVRQVVIDGMGSASNVFEGPVRPGRDQPRPRGRAGLGQDRHRSWPPASRSVLGCRELASSGIHDRPLGRCQIRCDRTAAEPVEGIRPGGARTGIRLARRATAPVEIGQSSSDHDRTGRHRLQVSPNRMTPSVGPS